MKKFILVLGILIALLALLAVVIALLPAPSLEKPLAKLSALGIPTNIDEFIPCELPDSENGAIIFEEASKIYSTLGKKQFNYYLDDFIKLDDSKKEEVTRIIMNDPDYKKLYVLLDKASRMKCQLFKKSEINNLLDLDLGKLSNIRSLVKILRLKSYIESQNKSFDDASDTACMILRISKCLEQERFLISQLVREAICMSGIESLDEIDMKHVSEIKLSKILSVLNDIDNKKAQQTGLSGEPFYAYQIGTKMILNNEIKKAFLDPSLLCDLEYSFKNKIYFYALISFNPKRIINTQIICYFNEFASVYTASDKPYFEGHKTFETVSENNTRNISADRLISLMLLNAIGRYYTNGEKLSAYIDVTRLGIANRLYKAKYGKFADSLDKLAPGLVSVIPKDPFSGNDYIYKKEGEGFMIYSYGENMKDDNGKFEKLNSKGDFDITWMDKNE